MDFITTARLLMSIQREHPSMRYNFDEPGNVVITIPVMEHVIEDFASAAKMFEPV